MKSFIWFCCPAKNDVVEGARKRWCWGGCDRATAVICVFSVRGGGGMGLTSCTSSVYAIHSGGFTAFHNVAGH